MSASLSRGTHACETKLAKHKWLLAILFVAWFETALSQSCSPEAELLLQLQTENSNLSWSCDTPVCNWPGVLCQNQQITQLVLNQSNIVSTLPPEWASGLKELRILLLGGNQITGELPQEWSKGFKKLEKMDLSNNQLTGTLPDSWGQESAKEGGGLRQLTDLSLGFNKFSGSIPQSSWGWETSRAFPEMNNLDLRTNCLSGDAPQSWRVGEDNSVQLDGNCLSGPDKQNINCAAKCQQPSPSSSNVGLIVGLTVGIVAAAAIAVAIAVIVFRRMRNKQQAKQCKDLLSLASFVRALPIKESPDSQNPATDDTSMQLPIIESTVPLGSNYISSSTDSNYQPPKLPTAQTTNRPNKAAHNGPPLSSWYEEQDESTTAVALAEPQALRGDPGQQVRHADGPAVVPNHVTIELPLVESQAPTGLSSFPAAASPHQSASDQPPMDSQYDHVDIDVPMADSYAPTGVHNFPAAAVLHRSACDTPLIESQYDQVNPTETAPLSQRSTMGAASTQPHPLHQSPPSRIPPEDSAYDTDIRGNSSQMASEDHTECYSRGYYGVIPVSSDYANVAIPPPIITPSDNAVPLDSSYSVEGGDPTTAAPQPQAASSTYGVQGGSEMRTWVIDASEVAMCTNESGNVISVGRGATSEVYKGVYQGRFVAVKVIEQSSKFNDPASRRRIMREINMLRQIDHPNMLKFHGTAFSDRHIMLIFDFMPNGDLFNALHSRAVGSPEGRQCNHEFLWSNSGHSIAIGIAEAVKYLHSKRIVHCDIKGQNVLLDENNIPKLGDLGLSKFANKEFVTKGGAIGTLAYAAPELLTQNQVTIKVDIYSVGVILWELVTGELPIREARRPPRIPEECSQQLADVITSCLSKQPDQRPNAAQLCEQLKSC